MSYRVDIPTLSANEVYTLTFEYEGTETIQLIVGDLTLETTDRRVVFTTTSPVNYIESNMNLTNKLVEKFGADKLLHFLLGWVIVSMGSPFGYIGIVGSIISYTLDTIKNGFNVFLIISLPFGLAMIYFFFIFLGKKLRDKWSKQKLNAIKNQKAKEGYNFPLQLLSFQWHNINQDYS
mgnify:CR=1 FL=1